MSKIVHTRGFLGRLLGLLHKIGLPLMKNVFKPFTKSVLIPQGLTAAASATHAGIHSKILGSGMILIISNEELEDTMKIVKSLEENYLLINVVNETIKIEVKNNKVDFLVC